MPFRKGGDTTRRTMVKNMAVRHAFLAVPALGALTCEGHEYCPQWWPDNERLAALFTSDE